MLRRLQCKNCNNDYQTEEDEIAYVRCPYCRSDEFIVVEESNELPDYVYYKKCRMKVDNIL